MYNFSLFCVFLRVLCILGCYECSYVYTHHSSFFSLHTRCFCCNIFIFLYSSDLCMIFLVLCIIFCSVFVAVSLVMLPIITHPFILDVYCVSFYLFILLSLLFPPLQFILFFSFSLFVCLRVLFTFHLIFFPHFHFMLSSTHIVNFLLLSFLCFLCLPCFLFLFSLSSYISVSPHLSHQSIPSISSLLFPFAVSIPSCFFFLRSFSLLPLPSFHFYFLYHYFQYHAFFI